jgi:hypothetical protein
METTRIHNGYAVDINEKFYRYFMGRKYYTSKNTTHYVYPNDRELNFSSHTILTGLLNKQVAGIWYGCKKVRYSYTSWR